MQMLLDILSRNSLLFRMVESKRAFDELDQKVEDVKADELAQLEIITEASQ